MNFKEKIEGDIKNKEALEIWQGIYNSFEEGGTDSVKEFLDNSSNKFMTEFDTALEDLEKLL